MSLCDNRILLGYTGADMNLARAIPTGDDQVHGSTVYLDVADVQVCPAIAFQRTTQRKKQAAGSKRRCAYQDTMSAHANKRLEPSAPYFTTSESRHQEACGILPGGKDERRRSSGESNQHRELPRRRCRQTQTGATTLEAGILQRANTFRPRLAIPTISRSLQ